MRIQYLILVPMIILAVGKVLLQGMISRNYLKNITDSALYNSIVFGGMSVLYLIFSGFRLPSLHILPYGALYGLMISGFQICYTVALQRGPVSHTSLIVTFSMAFPIAYGILYCGERLTGFSIAGLICIFLSLLLAIDFKQAKQHKFNLAWLLISITGMTMSGIAGVILKIQKAAYPDEDVGMLLTAYVTGTVFLLLTCRYFTVFRKQPKTVRLNSTRILTMLCSSLILGVYLLLYSAAAGLIPSVVFFPVINIAPATVISLFGILAFKDQLSRQQVFSLIFGITATLLLCL